MKSRSVRPIYGWGLGPMSSVVSSAASRPKLPVAMRSIISQQDFLGSWLRSILPGGSQTKERSLADALERGPLAIDRIIARDHGALSVLGAVSISSFLHPCY